MTLPTCTATEPERVIEKICASLSFHPLHQDYEGVAIENTYRITENGCECLNKWPFDE